MSTHRQVVEALLAFYRQVIRHPCLDNAVLKTAPASGWDTIDSIGLRELGKTEAVTELLKRLPYLKANGQNERLLVQYETVAIAWNQRPHVIMDQVNPLPGHCVYLTEGVDCEGYSLILDTKEGTITAYSTSGYDITSSYEEYERLHERERWRAHRTLPAAEFLNIWAAQYARLVTMLVPNITGQPTTGTYHSRVTNRLEGERLAQGASPFVEWNPDTTELTKRIEDEAMKQHHAARWRHTAAIYDCFLRHGWPDNFDKAACKEEVIEFEKQAAVEEKAFCHANNPDAALFDD